MRRMKEYAIHEAITVVEAVAAVGATAMAGAAPGAAAGAAAAALPYVAAGVVVMSPLLLYHINNSCTRNVDSELRVNRMT